jgi:hypothetical protein
MKVHVPQDHGATDVLSEEADLVVVRPHKFPGDTYVPLWFNFRADNDSSTHLQHARIGIQELASGRDTYQPYWKNCVWSRDGVNWDRVPDGAKQLEETRLTIETALGPNESVWCAIIDPLPYAWYVALCEELSAPAAAGLPWTITGRHLGHSVEGRPLQAYRINSGTSETRRQLLIVAGQHAVEQSGKLFAAAAVRGYHDGRFAGTIMETLLHTHDVTVVPLANPDGCYHGRMNSNAAGIVMGKRGDDSIESAMVLALIDELQPHVMINCHGWGNEVGVPPYEDVYRFSDDDPLFVHLRANVPGCSSSGNPHLFRDDFCLENHACGRFGTHCAITEVNYHWYIPPGGGAPRHPTTADLQARIHEYLHAIAGFCIAAA